MKNLPSTVWTAVYVTGNIQLSNEGVYTCGQWLSPQVTQYAASIILFSDRAGTFLYWTLGGVLRTTGTLFAGWAGALGMWESLSHHPGTRYMSFR